MIDDLLEVRHVFPGLVAKTARYHEHSGSVFAVQPDGVLSECRLENGACKGLDWGVDTSGDLEIVVGSRLQTAAASPTVVTGTLMQARLKATGVAEPGDVGRWAAQALVARLQVESIAMSLIRARALALRLEQGLARPHRWSFFLVRPHAALYSPVLQFSEHETVFPSPVESIAELAAQAGVTNDGLDEARIYDKHLELAGDRPHKDCTVYARTLSYPGSWLYQYWFYYPLDVGGLGTHLHDSEHLFVEVDKLGGVVRRVAGAGHGWLVGNNVYSTDRGLFSPRLPLHAIVELGKHATAPDTNADGLFTPGIDENEFRERAQVWGIRDVFGPLDNQWKPFDQAMMVRRKPEHRLAVRSSPKLFPNLDVAADCVLKPMMHLSSASERCDKPTASCAASQMLQHDDYRNPENILKNWVFPESHTRVGGGLGPRLKLRSLEVGYAFELDTLPLLEKLAPPGRLFLHGFAWRQDTSTADMSSCVRECEEDQGLGWGFRYELMLANPLGGYVGMRVFRPPFGEKWFSFGPSFEVTISESLNINVQFGVSLHSTSSPRFEGRATVLIPWLSRKRSTFGLEAQ